MFVNIVWHITFFFQTFRFLEHISSGDGRLRYDRPTISMLLIYGNGVINGGYTEWLPPCLPPANSLLCIRAELNVYVFEKNPGHLRY